MPTLAEIIAKQKLAKQQEFKQKLATHADDVKAFVTGEKNDTPKYPFPNLLKQQKKAEQKAVPKTFAALLKKSNKPVEKEKSKRDILFGSGITKKEIAKAIKPTPTKIKINLPTNKEAKEIKAAVAQQFPTAKEAETKLQILAKQKLSEQLVKEQPKIVSVAIPSEIEWDEYQLAALKGIRKQKYACLIGAAGTGKTTVTKQIVSELEAEVPVIDISLARAKSETKDPEMNVAMCFCAFTGRATQQLKRALPEHYHPMCATIHATLGYYPERYATFDEKENKWVDKIKFVPLFTADNKLPFKVCVVDEGGMVPIYLWDQLYAALPDDCRIIIIGDINQLPPVQGRSVLGFAMTKWPTFTLEHIHRQALDNPIIANAHKILKGHYPLVDKQRFAMMQIPGGSLKAQGTVINTIKHLSNTGFFNPETDALIVPQNIGHLGQEVLNERLVLHFNPIKKNKRYVINAGRKKAIFAVGDKVMLLQNDRERGLTNGMCGFVTSLIPNPDYQGKLATEEIVNEMQAVSIDLTDTTEFKNLIEEFSPEKHKEEKEEAKRAASHIMQVEFDTALGIKTIIDFSTAGAFANITLAYAFTCHKSQGGEYPNVVIMLHSACARMLNREWLYTAVTRAREKVLILYNERGLNLALHNQTIKGKTIQEKAERFLALQNDDQVSLPNLPAPKELK